MDQIKKIRLQYPFDFLLAIGYLSRSSLECMHEVQEQSVRKLISVDKHLYIIEVSMSDNEHLQIEILWSTMVKADWPRIIDYVKEWFDLKTDLSAAYKVLGCCDILKPLLNRFNGLTIVGIPDLFEVISWAIIGQQINLSFAYQVKKNFVSKYGRSVEYNDESFYLFPTPSDILKIRPEEWKSMKFSRQKARYIQLAAEKILSAELSKTRLLELEPSIIKKELLKLVGIGNWSADYILMRCFHIGWAYPRADAGLHQALKAEQLLERKPTQDELEELSIRWHPWQAYATFYLWRSLY